MKNVWRILAFTFLLVVNVFGQVHIKETVGISPKSPQNINSIPPCNTNYFVYMLYKGTITVTVRGTWDDNCDPDVNCDMILFSPTHEAIIPNVLNNVGATWTSPVYDAGTGINFGAAEVHGSGNIDTSNRVVNSAWGSGYVIIGVPSNDGRCSWVTDGGR